MPSEEFKVKVGVELDDSSLSRLAKDISGHKVEPIKVKVELQSKKLKKELNTLRKDLQDILKISQQLSKAGFGDTGQATKHINNQAKVYLDTMREIANLKNQGMKIDFGTKEGEKQFRTINREVEKLEKRATALKKALGDTGLASVERELEKIERGSRMTNAKWQDQMNQQKIDAFVAKYKEYANLQKEQIKLSQQGSKASAEQIAQNERAIARVKAELKENGDFR